MRNALICFVAGRYEGIDQRWIDVNVDAVVSLGDYVLSGGELAAAVVVDACVRLLPARSETANRRRSSRSLISQGGVVWIGHSICSAVASLPEGLQGGDHAAIERWRAKRPLARTWRRQPICSRALNCRSKSVRLIVKLRQNQGLADFGLIPLCLNARDSRTVCPCIAKRAGT